MFAPTEFSRQAAPEPEYRPAGQCEDRSRDSERHGRSVDRHEENGRPGGRAQVGDHAEDSLTREEFARGREPEKEDAPDEQESEDAETQPGSGSGYFSHRTTPRSTFPAVPASRPRW